MLFILVKLIIAIVLIAMITIYSWSQKESEQDSNEDVLSTGEADDRSIPSQASE